MPRTISDLSVGSLIYIDEVYDGEVTHAPYIYLGIDENGNARVLREYAVGHLHLNNYDILSYKDSGIDHILQNRSSGFLSRFTLAVYSALADTTISYTDFTDLDNSSAQLSQIRRKCFLLSYSELGFGDTSAGSEGISYLNALRTFFNVTEADTARICYAEDGTVVRTWTRSANRVQDNSAIFYTVRETGISGMAYPATSPMYYRPALSIISTTLVSDENSNEIFLLPGDNSNTVKVTGTVQIEKDFIERTVSEYVDAQQTIIGSNAFAQCSNLSLVSCQLVTDVFYNAFASCINLNTVNIPNVERISYQAFMNCSNLRKINSTKVSDIGTYTFMQCYNLKEATLPEVTILHSGAFIQCSQLMSITAPKVTTIQSYAFKSCWSLSEINFPNLTSLGYSAFANCSMLTEVSFSQIEVIDNMAFYYCMNLRSCTFDTATIVANSAFYYCSKLTSVSIPLAIAIYSDAFRFCYALQQIELPNVIVIGANAFSYCTNLETVILGLNTSTVCTLSHSNAFIGASSLSYIYVPSSLVESYKTATNWTYFSSIIYGV